MRRVISYFTVVFFCLISHGGILSADESDAAETKVRPIIIDIGSNRAPFTMFLSNGQATGLYVEFWELWSQHSGIPVRFVDYGFKNVRENLSNGRIDLHSGLFKNLDRKSWAEFSLPFHRVDTGLYFLASSKNMPNLKSLNESGQQLLAVQRNSYQETFINLNYPDIPLLLYDEVSEVFEQFLTGDLIAIFEEQPFMDAQIAGKGLRGLFKLGHAKVLANEIHGVVSKGNLELLNKVNQGISNIPVAEIIALEDKWLSSKETYFSIANSESVLTQPELEWVKALPELTLGIDLEWYPYDFINEDSIHSGLSADYIQYIKQQLPLEIAAQTNMAWREAFELTKQGEIDLLSAVVRTSEREKFINFTEPYAVFPSVVATYKDSIFVQDMTSLKGKLVAIEKGLILEEVYRTNHPQIEYTTFTKLSDALKLLTSGEVDAVIADLSSYNREVTLNKLTNITIAAFTPYELEVSIGVRKGLEPLVPILNKTLAQMSDEQKSILANKWFATKRPSNLDYLEIAKQISPYALILSVIIIYIVYSNKKLRLEIQERMKIEKSLEREKEKADAANRAKNSFLANMSHEIRTPMNAVVGMANLMEETSLDENQKFYNDTIQTSAASLLVIINDILDLSKIEAGKLKLDLHEFSLKKLVSRIHSQVKLELEKHKIEFSINIDESIPNRLAGDSVRLGQVLLNLIHNAIKFTPGGEITIGVSLVGIEQEKVELDFYVQDSGIGISKENIKKLFRTFGQADTSTTRNYGGTGLGLSICKQLCRLMGGDIWVESQLGEGSCFHFKLFFESVNKGVSAEPNAENKAELRLRNFKILLVDDNDVNLFIAEKMLLKSGAQVTTASNGQIAIDILRESQFDAILMDIQMPVLDGYEATRIIRNDMKLTKIPIIAITANVMDSDIEQGRQSGMNGHLGKPLNREKMITTIKQLVEQCRTKT